ncbi:MAG TPA: NAD(P)H-binding protein [Pyrinomonadaceae bacterium]|jgi:uncharacterized protein YbjT (DUF2867 family)
MKVLITGGSGALGRILVRTAADAGHDVRGLSRGERPQSAPSAVEWVRADLASGEGLSTALAGVEAIIHSASDPRRAKPVDVEGTRRLVEAARAAGVSHLVYISIVGIDDIPYSYYRRKREAEQIIEASGVPYTNLRATQFHSLVDFLISKAARLPLLLPLPTDFKFHSVADAEVAARLVACLAKGARGRVEFGGPEVLTLGEMAATWLGVNGVRKRLVRLPLPGAIAAGFRAGLNTTPDAERGTTRWRVWLEQNRDRR